MRAAALAALLAATAACGPGKFRLSGTVAVAHALRTRASQPNTVLLIVAKNRGGVPVALKRIVNPHFPVVFEMDAEDLIVPDSRPAGPFIVSAQVNRHGYAGRPGAGDLEGFSKDEAGPGDAGVHIVVDREL